MPPQWLSGILPQSSSSRRGEADQATILSYTNAVYYPNWRVYRQQGPASLNLAYISHVFYAFIW